MPKQRGTSKVADFKKGDRFWIENRAYKRTEIFEVIAVKAPEFRFVDIRHMVRTDKPEPVFIWTDRNLKAYEGQIRRVARLGETNETRTA